MQMQENGKGNGKSTKEALAKSFSKMTAAIAQPCRYIVQQVKNVYYLYKAAEGKYSPTLRTFGDLIHDAYMAAHEKWRTEETQRKLMESKAKAPLILKDAGIYLRNHPFPNAVPIDTSDITNFRITTVGIGLYEIFIPLRSPEELPNGLFPYYTTDKLNAALENDRNLWDLMHSPADPRPILYYMKVVTMYQPNNAAAVIRIRFTS